MIRSSLSISMVRIGPTFKAAAICLAVQAWLVPGALNAAPGLQQTAKKSEDKRSDSKSSEANKPVLIGSYGDWGAYSAKAGKERTCYALATPKDRAPGGLKRDPAYIFISNRPGENVRSEVSIIMGFPIKEGADSRAESGGADFSLVAKGGNAWIKNPAEEKLFIETLKKGSKLTVTAPSLKGHVTTDSYSLSGLSQALDRVQKECP
jgi:hypothetical protein